MTEGICSNNYYLYPLRESFLFKRLRVERRHQVGLVTYNAGIASLTLAMTTIPIITNYEFLIPNYTQFFFSGKNFQ